MSGAILIGHTLGFDLAVIQRECERAGLPGRRRARSTRNLLAQVAEPRLGGYTLEHLSNWLERKAVRRAIPRLATPS